MRTRAAFRKAIVQRVLELILNGVNRGVHHLEHVQDQLIDALQGFESALQGFEPVATVAAPTWPPTQLPCTNNASLKFAEVCQAIETIPAHQRMRIRDLFGAGAFRHAEDVAFASILLSRNPLIPYIDLETQIAEPYEHHKCDPVYPS